MEVEDSLVVLYLLIVFGLSSIQLSAKLSIKSWNLIFELFKYDALKKVEKDYFSPFEGFSENGFMGKILIGKIDIIHVLIVINDAL